MYDANDLLSFQVYYPSKTKSYQVCLYNYFVKVLPIQFMNIDPFLRRKLKENKVSATKFIIK